MKHWLMQYAKIDPYSHEVVWRNTNPDGTPKTKTMPKEQAIYTVYQSQANGTTSDGTIHTWLVLDKNYEVPDDPRGVPRHKAGFKPEKFKLREPPVYDDGKKVALGVATSPMVDLTRGTARKS